MSKRDLLTIYFQKMIKFIKIANVLMTSQPVNRNVQKEACINPLSVDADAVVDVVEVAVVKVEEIEEQSGSQMNVEKLRKMASVVCTGRKGSMRSSFWEVSFLKADDAFIHSILTCSWFQDGRISYEEFQVIMKTGTPWRKASLDKEGNASVTYILVRLENAKLTPKVPDEVKHEELVGDQADTAPLNWGDYSGVMSPLVVLHVVEIRSCVKTVNRVQSIMDALHFTPIRCQAIMDAPNDVNTSGMSQRA
ncbi:hypothetical protein Tco_0517174 [Tanacetum coccineum]